MKKLIVCCDGTWQNSESGLFAGTAFSWLYRGTPQQPTNVTRIARALQPVDADQRSQIIFYQQGIGSEGNLLQRLLGGAIGAGLSVNIREAYTFIAANWMPGDEIYLLGFSRGAFTARSVGGLISDLGLLTRDGLDHLVNIFADWESAGRDHYTSLLAQHNAAFTLPANVDTADARSYLAAYRAELHRLGWTRTVDITAVAVWDTVGALGIPVNPILQRLGLPYHLRWYRFYDVKLSSHMRHAFQALALDEHRSAYRPALWDMDSDNTTTQLRQTWFPGAHSDIGGGHDDADLANISLAWMMSQLSPFLAFNPTYLATQRAARRAYLERQHAPPGAYKWAAGRLQDSARKLAYLVLGKRWRTPGRYHALDRRTDRKLPESPLRNTCERVHVSVRSRERTGGVNHTGRVEKYAPRAMEGYKLHGAEAKPGEARWEYEGTDREASGKVLAEDELGVFEKEIFEDYVSAAP